MATATWDRGRHADKPSEIPKSGWKDTLFRVKGEMKHDHISIVAGAMAYYALFSLVPAFSAVVLIYAWFSDPAEIRDHLNSVAQFIPEDGKKFLDTTLTSLSAKAGPKLGLGALGALAVSLWSASKAIKALIDGLNIVYEEEEKRGFVKYTLTALALTLLGIVLAIAAMLVVVGIPAITNFLNLGALESVATLGSYVLLLFMFSLYLSAVYRYSPCRAKAKWRWVTWGSMIASVLFALTSALFSWYAKEFGNFNKTYGSLGAAVVLMTWFYLSSYVILLGAEINAELEHQTKNDSTTEPEKPMGERNARMADTVGPTYNEVKARS